MRNCITYNYQLDYLWLPTGKDCTTAMYESHSTKLTAAWYRLDCISIASSHKYWYSAWQVIWMLCRLSQSMWHHPEGQTVGASFQYWGSRQNAGCIMVLESYYANVRKNDCACMDIPSFGRSAHFDSWEKNKAAQHSCPQPHLAYILISWRITCNMMCMMVQSFKSKRCPYCCMLMTLSCCPDPPAALK